MNRILTRLVLSAAVAATTLAAVPAGAADRWHQPDRRPPAVRQDDGAALLAAGIIGLAAGAIVAGIANGNQHRPAAIETHRHPQPRPQPDRDYFPPAPPQPTSSLYDYDLRRTGPWGGGWHRACGGGQRFC